MVDSEGDPRDLLFRGEEEDILGWGNNRLGEGLSIKLVERYTRRHGDVSNCHLVGVDKDQLSESELRKLICALESGVKVVNLPTADGGVQLCVSVLSLGPHGVRGTILEERSERPGETSCAPSERGVELEVIIS